MERASFDVRIPMKDIYEHVTFGPPELPDLIPASQARNPLISCVWYADSAKLHKELA
jgi:hypothetical protein